jgi:hypothetical protein
MTEPIVTFTEAAEALGVKPNTIGDLVRKLGIRPTSVPRNGNAKGLTPADMRLIRERLKPRPRVSA